jgi:hypothetical protein
MKLFGMDVIVSDVLQPSVALVLGDWSSYIRSATTEELAELHALMAGHGGPVTMDALKKYAEQCGLAVNISRKDP